MEETLRSYFQAWLDGDVQPVKETFSDDALYRECYGPEYHGRAQIVRWFEEWNRRGKVLEWSISRVVEQGDTAVAEWYFKCVYDGVVSGFDGVTVAQFDGEGKIVRLCEFQSKSEHFCPYGE